MLQILDMVCICVLQFCCIYTALPLHFYINFVSPQKFTGSVHQPDNALTDFPLLCTHTLHLVQKLQSNFGQKSTPPVELLPGDTITESLYLEIIPIYIRFTTPKNTIQFLINITPFRTSHRPLNRVIHQPMFISDTLFIAPEPNRQ